MGRKKGAYHLSVLAGAVLLAVSVVSFVGLLGRPAIPWDELAQTTGIPAKLLPEAIVRVDGRLSAPVEFNRIIIARRAGNRMAISRRIVCEARCSPEMLGLRLRGRPLLAGQRPSSLDATSLIIESRSTTRSGRSVLYKAAVRRMELSSHRGQQRERPEHPGTIHH